MIKSAASRPSAQAAELMRNQQGLNRYASIALTMASFFLIIMAILVNSPPLFYMATAIVATLLGSRLQANLAGRGLRFERSITPAVRAGELVTVHITVWSEKKLKRPLLSVLDHLPKRLRPMGETPSVPIAPSFDQPIQTKYSFKPTRRGRYTWSQITVIGTDALGLVSQARTYSLDPVHLTVYPNPLQVNIPFPPGGGWGQSDLESGRATGSGLETRGIRQYVPGDPIKTIHWPSTARSGKPMVKEFESGAGLSLKMMLQRTQGTNYGDDETSAFEAMCSHTLFLCSSYAKKGAKVLLPQMEAVTAVNSHPEARERELREALTDIQPTSPELISAEVARLKGALNPGEALMVCLSIQDPDLPQVMLSLTGITKACLLYNPQDYQASQEAKAARSATDPGYIAALERAGCLTFVMPRAEVIL